MTNPLGLGRPQFVPSFVSTSRTTETEAEQGVAEGETLAAPEAEAEIQPGPRLPRRVSSRAQRQAHNPFSDQLRANIDARLPSEGPAPLKGQLQPGQLGPIPPMGTDVTPPPGQGGKGAPPVPGQGGKGQGQPGPQGGVLNEAGRSFAQDALQQTKPPSVNHPYVQYKDQIRGDLDRLGLLQPGTGRIHIDDVTQDHGFAVTRAAAGPTSLAQGADVSLNIGGVPAEVRDARRDEATLARTTNTGDRRDLAQQGALTSDQHIALIGDELEANLLNRGDAVAHVRSQLSEDGKDTFMNMSWGVTPERGLGRSVGQMMTAPEGSAAYKEVTEILGHPPTRTELPTGGTKLDEKEYAAVRKHLEGKLDTLLASDEHKTRMDAGRTALASELAAGRDQGLLVFMAPGNQFESADRHGRPDLAVDAAQGVPGMINVGATDINGPGTDDDAVATFSNSGPITVSAAGVEIPVGSPDLFSMMNGDGSKPAPKNVDGTSFSSPIATEAAYLADAVNPNLGVNDIEKLLTDPRAVHDIAGTDRDGVGQLDHFAVALLAKNPNLTRAQIDETRAFLRTNPNDAQVAALTARLGLD